MIVVSRLNGEAFGLNADLIERVEAMPDTVLTLVDGKKLLVRESVEDVVDRVVRYHASILRLAHSSNGAEPASPPSRRPPPLRLVAEARTDEPVEHL